MNKIFLVPILLFLFFFTSEKTTSDYVDIAFGETGPPVYLLMASGCGLPLLDEDIAQLLSFPLGAKVGA